MMLTQLIASYLNTKKSNLTSWKQIPSYIMQVSSCWFLAQQSSSSPTNLAKKKNKKKKKFHESSQLGTKPKNQKYNCESTKAWFHQVSISSSPHSLDCLSQQTHPPKPLTWKQLKKKTEQLTKVLPRLLFLPPKSSIRSLLQALSLSDSFPTAVADPLPRHTQQGIAPAGCSVG